MKKLIVLFSILVIIFSCKKEDNNSDSENSSEKTMTVSVVTNALPGDLGQIGAQVTLSPGIYDFLIESSTAKFGKDQTAWAGVFFYTHALNSKGQPAPNLMISLNGLDVKRTIDLSNQSSISLSRVL